MRGALLFALVAGCQFDGGLGTGLLCPTGECPAGESCVDGRCSAQSGGGADAADGVRDDAAAGPDSATPLGPNLVVNPGMEEGIEPWTPFNALLTTSDAEHSDAASLEVCAEAADEYFTVYQDVVKSPPNEIVAGAHYVASVWVRAAAAATPSSMNLTIRESGGSQPSADHDGPTVNGPGDAWIQLEASGTVEEGDRDNLILIVWGLDTSGSACFLVDDAVQRAY